ncbi:MAG: c-type cytochrome [Vicinamibacterales bacterium]
MGLLPWSVPARSASPLVLTAWLLATVAVVGCSREPPPSIGAGRDLYRQNGCASCHGAEGHGDGPVGATLETRPRDFRDAAAFKQGADIESVTATIATGVLGGLGDSRSPDPVHHHSQVMPRFDHLSERERHSLALYVISLRTASQTGRSQP